MNRGPTECLQPDSVLVVIKPNMFIGLNPSDGTGFINLVETKMDENN